MSDFVTIPFPLPTGYYIRGQRYKVNFERLTPPREEEMPREGHDKEATENAVVATSRGYVGKALISVPSDKRQILYGERVTLHDGRKGAVIETEEGCGVLRYIVKLDDMGLIVGVKPDMLVPDVDP
jgi:hypothetical protein